VAWILLNGDSFNDLVRERINNRYRVGIEVCNINVTVDVIIYHVIGMSAYLDRFDKSVCGRHC
jgi:hypothetical protein